MRKSFLQRVVKFEQGILGRNLLYHKILVHIVKLSNTVYVHNVFRQFENILFYHYCTLYSVTVQPCL